MSSADSMRFLPPKIASSLFEFQKRGVEYGISRGGRCLIADEMGLGKTLQALSVAYYYRSEWPLLIITPASVKYSWIEEIEKWLPEVLPQKIHLVRGVQDVQPFASCQVAVMSIGLFSYSKVNVLMDSLKKRKFQVVIVDESHYMKGRSSRRTSNVLKVLQTARRIIMLSGTPALSRPCELFPQINMLAPSVFPKFFPYVYHYCDAHRDQFNRFNFKGASNLEQLNSLLSEHIMIRRLKSQVLHELPMKVRQKVSFDIPTCELKDMQLCFDTMKAFTDSNGRIEKPSQGQVFQLNRLMTNMYTKTGELKVPGVVEYMKELLKDSEIKFLVFAHHIKVQLAIAEQLVKLKQKFIHISGDVPSNLRHDYVRQFQEDKSTTVALLSLRAANMGIHLTAATHVIFAELCWNPGELIQAEDRCHRIGQKQSVHVHYLIARGTLDELMWASLSRKVAMTSHVLNGKVDTFCVKDSEDTDMKSLLSSCFFWLGENEMGDEDVQSLIDKARRRESKLNVNDFPEELDLDLPSDDSDDDLLSSENWKRPNAKSSARKVKDMGSLGDDSEGDFAPEQKKFRIVSAESGEDVWECSFCSFVNDGSAFECAVCGDLQSPLECDHSFSSMNSSMIAGGDFVGRDEGSESGPDDAPAPFMDEDESSVKEVTETSETARLLAEAGLDQAFLEDVFGADDSDDEEKAKESLLQLKRADGRLPSPVIHLPADIPLYEGPQLPSTICNGELKFFISAYTGRFHIYNKNDDYFYCNVSLSEVLGDYQPENLPKVLTDPLNFRATRLFVRKYQRFFAVLSFSYPFTYLFNRLNIRDKALVRNAREITADVYETLASVKREIVSKSKFTRHLKKEVFNQTAVIDAAEAAGGKVHIIEKQIIPIKSKRRKRKTSRNGSNPPIRISKHIQGVSATGELVCSCCTKLFKPDKGVSLPYGGRFCSEECYEDFRVRTSRSEARRVVREEEKGVCNICQVDTKDLLAKITCEFSSTRMAMTVLRILYRLLKNRADCLDVLMKTGRFSELSDVRLKGIIEAPIAGKLWHTDHIIPVSHGGGGCSRKNLRALCVPCHVRVTKQLLAKK
eukprot:m.110335 g.110335  ORF g.110335 m.110335 type:complete len:1079 (+) comp37387_c0_seq24:86-3322(+)